MKPNIVLIMVDQMRGDCLGVNGNEFIETPNLDMMPLKDIILKMLIQQFQVVLHLGQLF